jgi:hypothetical protein
VEVHARPRCTFRQRVAASVDKRSCDPHVQRVGEQQITIRPFFILRCHIPILKLELLQGQHEEAEQVRAQGRESEAGGCD